MSSAPVEDYVTAIFRLSHDPGVDAPVTTSEIAERLGLTAATVTSMIQRLSQPETDLLQYTPYQGVRLTGEQSVARYVTGAQLAQQPSTKPFRGVR